MYARIPNKAKPSKSVSTDQTRPRLMHAELRQNGDAWELVGTDSYKLARIPLEVCTDDPDGPELVAGPISPDALKAIEKAGAFRANGNIQPVDQFGRPTGLTFDRSDDVGKFPEVDQLMPEYAPAETVEIGINAKLLHDLAQALGKVGGGDVVKLTVTLDERGGRRPSGAYQMLRPILAEVGEARGLLMPIRLP